MALKILTTLSRSVQEFVPLDPAGKSVRMYCCGPTVHDFAHIGNFRTFVLADLVRRYLEFRGYEVNHVMNITDVEDKIIARVKAAGTTLGEFTKRYESAFLEDLKTLGCVAPHSTPRAADSMKEIIDLIVKLVDRGIAYQATDGSVYFSIEKYQQAGHQYGQLLKLNFDDMRPGERVSRDEYAKDAVADFALWKARVPEDGEVFWESPWGEGRPGWHIECSAMSMSLLGPSFDLHLGGEDLVFPHHEDEIAQSEAACLQPDGQRFVKYWLHGAHLLVEGKKMSKSLGNFFTLRDLLEQGFTGREIRFVLLSAHYRETFNFTIEGLKAGQSALGRLDECLTKLKELAGEHQGQPNPKLLEEFTQGLDDDLNVSAGWAAIFDWVRDTNKLMAQNQLSEEQAAAHLAAWERIDSVLGVGASLETEIPESITQLLEDRQAARKARDFKKADEIRDTLKSEGWIIEDTPKGPRLKRI